MQDRPKRDDFFFVILALFRYARGGGRLTAVAVWVSQGWVGPKFIVRECERTEYRRIFCGVIIRGIFSGCGGGRRQMVGMGLAVRVR